MFLYYASDILNEKYLHEFYLFIQGEKGFWRSSIDVEEMEPLIDKKELVIEKANEWLANKLRNDVNLRTSWLWLHQRWKPNVGQERKVKLDE